MIIMPVKEGENIEKALKKFKRKYERTGVLKELRRRQYFTKPSIAKREAMQHAIYVAHMTNSGPTRPFRGSAGDFHRKSPAFLRFHPTVPAARRRPERCEIRPAVPCGGFPAGVAK